MGQLSEYSEEEIRWMIGPPMFPASVINAKADAGGHLKRLVFRAGADVLYVNRVGDDLWTAKRFRLSGDSWAAIGEPESWTDGEVQDLLRREWAVQLVTTRHLLTEECNRLRACPVGVRIPS